MFQTPIPATHNLIHTIKLVDADGVVTVLKVGDVIAWDPDAYSLVISRNLEPLRTQFGNDNKIFVEGIKTEGDFFFFTGMILGLSGFNFVPYRWGSSGQYPAVTIVA
ncbi:MAG: hypothetical protein HY454_00800 [Parcubacteria group bacterium]|nr:hypothetical protein [Parcubacteria group bacterium]